MYENVCTVAQIPGQNVYHICFLQNLLKKLKIKRPQFSKAAKGMESAGGERIPWYC